MGKAGRRRTRGRQTGNRILEVMVEVLAAPTVLNRRRVADALGSTALVDPDLFMVNMTAPTLVTLPVGHRDAREVRDLTSLTLYVDGPTLRTFGERILGALGGQDTLPL